jgi:dephospho-CoA kinase
MAPPYKIGITGSIGCGKSLVGTLLANQGVAVLDTDHVVHQLLATHPTLIAQITNHFGPQVLTDTGEVDRRALAQRVFDQPDEKAWLESVVHPLVRQQTQAFLNDPQGEPIRAVLVPLLFESDSAALYDETWAVVVDEATQWQRLMAREANQPGWSASQARQRIAGQWPQTHKAQHATWVVDNSGSPQATKSAVLDRLNNIQQRGQTLPPREGR